MQTTMDTYGYSETERAAYDEAWIWAWLDGADWEEATRRAIEAAEAIEARRDMDNGGQ